MKFQLFTQVALREDMPKFNLRHGTIDTIVEYYPMLDGQADGYSLEGLISEKGTNLSREKHRG